MLETCVEIIGAALFVAGIVVLCGGGWGLLVAGLLTLVKAVDLALSRRT